MCTTAVTISPEVTAALIAALVALFGIWTQLRLAQEVRINAQKNAAEAQKHAEKIANEAQKHTEKIANEAQKHAEEILNRTAKLQKENTELFLRLQHILEDQGAYKNARRQALSDLWNSALVAQSAADGIVEESNSEQPPTMIGRTAEFLQEISIFLKKSRRPDLNVYLEQADASHVTKVQRALVGLFLALDPDAEDKSSYRSKLDSCRKTLEKAMNAFHSQVKSDLAPAN